MEAGSWSSKSSKWNQINRARFNYLFFRPRPVNGARTYGNNGSAVVAGNVKGKVTTHIAYYGSIPNTPSKQLSTMDEDHQNYGDVIDAQNVEGDIFFNSNMYLKNSGNSFPFF